MTSPGFGNFLDDLFGPGSLNRPSTPTSSAKIPPHISARRQCEDTSHRYQIHGKINPTKISCSRCGTSWGIGPRTEPS